MSIPLVRTGQKMPLVGFGLWKVTKSTCAETVYQAIKQGYRLLDGACDYGNEKEAGDGLKRAISEGLVKREDVFVTTKLWNAFHKPEHARKLIKRQLSDWGLEYFDLFLVHFPIAIEYVDPDHRYPCEWFGDDGKVHLADVPYQKTWETMEEFVDQGLAKNIGISNVQGGLLADIMRYARYQPAVNQIELHPYLTQEDLVAQCKAFGIAVTAYSSLGPASYVELNDDRGAQSLLTHDVVAGIASKANKTSAQVLLRWSTQRGIAVIPKSNSHHRLEQNLDVVEWSLSEADIATISALNINLRLNDPKGMDARIAIFA